jgi:hypothetical protein
MSILPDPPILASTSENRYILITRRRFHDSLWAAVRILGQIRYGGNYPSMVLKSTGRTSSHGLQMGTEISSIADAIYHFYNVEDKYRVYNADDKGTHDQWHSKWHSKWQKDWNTVMEFSDMEIRDIFMTRWKLGDHALGLTPPLGARYIPTPMSTERAKDEERERKRKTEKAIAEHKRAKERMSSLGRPSQYLWLLRRLADKGELVDAAGEPITNKKGEVDVYTALCLLDFVPKNRRFKPPGLTSTEWDKMLKIEKKARASLLKLMKKERIKIIEEEFGSEDVLKKP